MQQYHDLLNTILDKGVHKSDRTGTGTISVFGHQMRFDLTEGFPLVTTKKCHLRSIIHELLWFLTGNTNIKYLKDNGVTIWDSWADANGDLGPVYGYQWRSWPQYDDDGYVGPIDQISNVIRMIKSNPDSRRLMVSAWNPAQVDDMALPPCHSMFQFYVADMNPAQRQRYADLVGKPVDSVPTKALSCQLYQRKRTTAPLHSNVH